MITIKSDGTAEGTYVYNEDGKRLRGITHIVIHPLQVGVPVAATLTFVTCGLELNAIESTAVESPQIGSCRAEI